MSELKIMILCGRAPRHLYVANRLCRAAQVTAIVHETGDNWTMARFRRLMKPSIFWQKSWRWLRDRKRYWGNPEARFFFDKEIPRLDRPDLVHQVPHINHPEVLALAEHYDPDVIAVFGTSLIRGPLLHKGRKGIVNLHGGLSPNYRGADCTFWALYNNDIDQIGCTLHFINEGIDTGDLIAHVSPEIQEGDDELTLFWRAVRDSAEAYAELLHRLNCGERLGVAQSDKGRLYQVRNRRWRHERSLEQRLRQGLLKGRSHPSRVRWFFKEQAEVPSSLSVKTSGLR